MILKKLHVKNFRSLRDAMVELSPQTAIIGANGCGKSTFLRAIDRFYSPSSSIELDDFFQRNVHEPIEIALTFTRFTDAEEQLFETRIQNNEMTVVRIFQAGGSGKTNGRYHGITRQHAEFSPIRATPGANDKKKLYNELRQSSDIYASLPQLKKVDEIEVSLASWEGEHPEKLSLCRDDGQFFGFSNVARGNLLKSTSFVFIPAVRDVAADAVDAKGAAVARLMELVVRSAIQRRQEIRALQADVSSKYLNLIDPQNLPELEALSDGLTETLQDYYPDASVRLKWRPPEELTLPLPSAEVSLQEAGFDGPVDRKGHGLQRAFIFTLLQHLGRAAAASAVISDEAKTKIEPGKVSITTEIEEWIGGSDGAELAEAAVAPEDAQNYLLPGLILAIEEPELYQHPTKQRHFSKVLTSLSNGSLPGVAAATQVIFASHSSLFVSMDRFDEVRLARRERGENGVSECKLSSSTLADVAARLEKAYLKKSGSFSAEGLRGRLHIIGSELAEGFFADLVVLVEGPSDLAALLAAAAMRGADFEAAGIAVLSANGKNNQDRPAAIFNELGIPTYVIFDCDKRSDGHADGINQNKALQRLLGSSEVHEAKTVVSDDFASFEINLETTLRTEIGDDVFNFHLDRVSSLFGMGGREDVIKAPFAMREVLASAAKDGRQSDTLRQIVEAISSKRANAATTEITQTELLDLEI